jgi:hypothetical protein
VGRCDPDIRPPHDRTQGNVIDAPGYLWSSEKVRLEDVFPSGTAHMHGMNLPVRSGTYRVTFDSRTGEYSFEEEGTP